MIPRPEALADLAIKSTLLLAVGSLAVASLSRRRPALAAACGHAALVGLWLLPLALFFVPQLNWHILPAEPVEQPLVSTIVEPSPEPPALPDFALSTPALPPPGPLPDFTPEPPPPAPVVEPEPLPPAEPWDPVSLALAAYAAVSGLFLVRLAFALLAVRRLVRRSTPVLDSPWTAALAELSKTGNPVQLVWSDRLSVPVVVGWLRPAILLPAHLQSSDAPTARAVLLHELAHIHRRDYPWNVFLRLTLSLYWPHPLAWLLSRTLSESRENACDAYCVHALGGPAPYADALLSVVSLRLQSRIPTPSLGLAMARPSRLRTRLARLATLPGTPTATPSLPSRLLLLLLMIPLSALLGPLHLAPAQAEPLAEPAGRVLTLRVVSAETGKPLPKPTARVWLDHNEDDRTGDDRGLLKITHSTTAADRTIVVDVAAPGHAMQRHFFNNPAIPEEFTVKLHPGETLGGVVQDEQGKPIAGATILLSNYEFKRKDSHEFFYELTTTSGPDGRWQTTSAPHTDSKSLDLKVIHPDFARIGTYGRPGATATLEDLRANRAVVTLRKGVPVEGRVTDDQGRPVANADVYLAPPTYVAYHRHDVDRTRTDADGRFRLGQVQPGEWAVYVIAGGFAPFHVTSKAEAENLDLNVRLNPGHVLKGRVVDGDGKPIAGAVTHWLTWNGVPCLNVKLRTDEQGRFRWDGAPKDGIAFRIDALGYSNIGQASVKADAEEETYTLKPSLSIAGTILDATTNAPIKNATLQYGAADPETGEVAEWLDPPSGSIFPSTALLGLDIPAFADAFRLRITANNYEPYVSRLIRTSEKSLMGFEARLTPIDPKPQANATKPVGREFTLRVVSAETGKPVADADVRLSRSLMYEMRKTDADGVLRIRHSTGAGDRRLAFNVIAKGFALQSRAYFPEPGKAIPDGETVRLRPGETLGGFVKDEQGRPISGALVALWSHNYTPSDPNEMMFDLPAISGPDGRWETSSAPKTTGELLGVRCIHPDHVSIRNFSKQDAPSIADLRAGKGVIVLKKGVAIAGRVTDKDGKPVAGAEVVGSTRPDQLKIVHDVDVVRTDADGRYRLGQVSPGSFSVVVESSRHAPAAETIQVGTEPVSLDFVLDPPNILRGRVVDPDGKPLADAQVNLFDWKRYRGFDKVWWTDQEGRFAWENGPRDDVRVSVSRAGFSHVSFGNLTSEKDENVFTLHPMISARGSLKDAFSGKPINAGRVAYRSFDRKTGAASGWVSKSVDASLRSDEVGHVRDGEYALGIYLEKDADVYQFRIQADGYEEYISEDLRYDVPHRTLNIKLNPLQVDQAKARPGAMLKVLDPSGQPTAKAQVFAVKQGGSIGVTKGLAQVASENTTAIEVARDGTFSMPDIDKDFVVVAIGEDFFGHANDKALKAAPVVRTARYATLKGRYVVGDRPVAGQTLELLGSLQDPSTEYVSIFSYARIVTDSDGRFHADQLVPMNNFRVQTLNDEVRSNWTRRSGPGITLRAGETTEFQFGGTGRAVVGRVAAPDGATKPIDFRKVSGVMVRTAPTMVPFPLELVRGKTADDLPVWRWLGEWRESAQGMAARTKAMEVGASLAADGTFRLDDLPPGDYRLELSVNETSFDRKKFGPFSRVIREFTVSASGNGPVDLGTLRLNWRVNLKVGDKVPDFEVRTVDGKTVRLSDYGGKSLLLDVGGVSTERTWFQLTRLNAARAKHGDKAKLAFLSLVFSPDTAETRKFVADKGQGWPQAIVGALSNPLADRLGIEDGDIPSALLIAPDGTLAARGHDPVQVVEAIKAK